VALIEGEPGIGKTLILDTVLEAADIRGLRVLVGHADEVERARPFGPLVEAFDGATDVEPRRAEITRLVRGDPSVGPSPIEPARDPGLQFRIVDDFVDLVEELALERPVALAIEDVQWADLSTLITVRSLSRRMTGLPLALLLTARPLPRRPELEQLIDALRRDGAHLLTLGPLDDDLVTALVADLVSAEPTAALLDQVAGAGGNPLFVTELITALDEQGAIEIIDGRAEVHEASRPPSLRLTILGRLTFLDGETLELLRVASVLGTTFSVDDVATVLDRPATDLLKALREAIRAGVLEEHDGRLTFRHELIREAIYEDLPASARAALHLQAGRHLAHAGAATLRVAEQFALGAQPGDADAVTWLHAAARQTAPRAPAVAVELLERALELTGESDEIRPLLLADLLPSLLWSGRPGDAETHAREGLAANPAAEIAGRLHLGLVAALSAQGRHRDVIAEARRAATEPALTSDARSQLHAEAANALAFLDDLDGAADSARSAVDLGTPAHSDGSDMGWLVLAEIARLRGNLDQSLDCATRSRARTRTRPGTRLRWPAEMFLAMTLQQLDRFDDAHDALRAARETDEELGKRVAATRLPL
jgi:tetratricopeptide (TPR) repeat protein